MSRTRMSTLLVFAVIGGGIGWIVEMMLVMTGRVALVPPVTLAVTLAVLAIVVLMLAWPIRQSVRGDTPRRVDPFRATRVVVLSKASSLSGSVLLGAATGILLFLLTRPVVAESAALWLTAAAVLSAAVLLAAGLIAENWCTIPPDDRSDGVAAKRLDSPGQATSPR